ncbi:regulatory protein [Alteromonadaceae bacterium Bs31]|nr:regulatory protein [Alteromonadaceae bacterium Bs31]
MSDQAKAIYDKALRLLARREYSERELRQKLPQKMEGSQEQIYSELDEIIARLQSLGYQSDERFAFSYARMRQSKGFGAERISLELGEKGVATELVAQALAALEEKWPDIIGEAWQKKFKSPPADYAEKAKQQNFLRYRGFRYADIEQLFADIR